MDEEEFDTPDECACPVSSCCGWPPIGETELCGRCKDHCGWYEGEQE